ncbi:hypothetical protein Vafri_16226 [Volvox africanus]|uniref:Uncharacterized protein n=1 Tax=Volvox africanus TaxID=51714 RepID=A0A8J4BHW1_9CHLO|nr:hypothetical protein Vafri_16226 [Volvox africanus]
MVVMCLSRLLQVALAQKDPLALSSATSSSAYCEVVGGRGACGSQFSPLAPATSTSTRLASSRKRPLSPPSCTDRRAASTAPVEPSPPRPMKLPPPPPPPPPAGRAAPVGEGEEPPPAAAAAAAAAAIAPRGLTCHYTGDNMECNCRTTPESIDDRVRQRTAEGRIPKSL